MVDFAHVDALAAGYHQRGGQPGLAYGIVAGGELVHAAGLGERHLGGPPPDAGTVFRIASMTKSFTASVILTLRDDGLLKLDDLAEDYVPELRGWPLVTPDSARISIRHLLTMTAGFPTDDPWGDRQQGLPLEDFGHFLAKGVSFNCAPGTRFEYSNLGYAILGRVITAVTGMAYPDYVRHRLLKPLGMTRTGYEAEEFEVPQQAAGPAGVALGYSTCAARAPLAARLLEAVVRQDGPAAHGNSVAIASPGPWPETLAAREEVSQLLGSWDDAAAQRLFSPNVAMDAPFEERRRRIALIRERIGEFGDD